MGPRRGFKVTDAERKTRVGIAAEAFEDLHRKTYEKFKLDNSVEIEFWSRDGVGIKGDDDFQKLKPQTLLIWAKKGERAETDAEILYRTIREVNLDFLTTGEKVQEFFTEQMKHKVYQLAEVLKELDGDKAKISSKEGDAEWFKGVDTRSKTKEEYMFRRSQDRIKTYFYKTKDELRKKSNLPQNELNKLLTDLQTHLKTLQFFGCYFDRRATEKLCDSLGTFDCQGLWNKKVCPYGPRHAINPYRSREDRIVFQTWNLDHRIERTRSVVPAICTALAATVRSDEENGKRRISIDAELVFRDLFTLDNLKLVHIVCHDKGAHETVTLDRYIKYI